MKTLAVLGACAAVLVAGCGDDAAPEKPGSGALVTYARSGGVASVPEQLVLQPDGMATVEAGIDGARASFELEPNELEQLRAELEAADFGALEPSPTVCADCFSYQVVYGGNTISYDEADSPPDSVTTVVAHLGQITADHYPSDAFEPSGAN
jgi:hypothetical protein